MNKFFILILTLVISQDYLWGQRTLILSSGTETAEKQSTLPTRNIEYVSDGIIVTYTFTRIGIQDDSLFPGSTICTIEGFGLNGEAEEPATLSRYDTFTLPDNTSASVSIVESIYKDFNYTLAPAREPLPDNTYEGYTTDNVKPTKAYSGFLPQQIIAASDIKIYRGIPLINIELCPIQYNYMSQQLRVFQKIKYKITFKTNADSVRSRNANYRRAMISSEDNMLNNISLNYTPNLTDATNQNEVQDYLVLTVPRFKGALTQSFAKWKKQLGYNVTVIDRNDWTSDLVKATVKEFYDSHPAMYYLLIVGTHEDVPAEVKIRKEDNKPIEYLTDYYYGCVDGDDDIADIYRGRILVRDIVDYNHVFIKMRKYEKTPITDENYYRNGLNCAYFEDQNEDGYADRRFAQTSEDIRDYLIGQGKDVTRVYYAQNYVNPRYWDNGTFSYGEAIPSDLRKPAFAWNGKASNIKDAINNGVFYVLHRDHGSYDGWGEPKFTISDIDSLTNIDKPPVVFSINCLTGKFNAPTDCFASKFMRRHMRGCVAIFAASEVSYSGNNDALVCGMFDAIWPYPGLRPFFPRTAPGGNTPVPTYTLGQILDQGLNRMSEMCTRYNEYTREIFHCFGDPSMRIYTETPTPFEGVEVTRAKDGVSVLLNNDYARITLYDEAKDSIVTTTMGRRASCSTLNPQNITVCVSNHNRIPYIDSAPRVLNLQNETIEGPKSYEGKFINIGSTVTDEINQGPVYFKNGDISLKARKFRFEPETTISIDCQFEAEIKLK